MRCQSASGLPSQAPESLSNFGPDRIHVQSSDPPLLGLFDPDRDFFPQFLELPGAKPISVVEELNGFAKDVIGGWIFSALDLLAEDAF
jgi:hypothetical protein